VRKATISRSAFPTTFPKSGFDRSYGLFVRASCPRATVSFSQLRRELHEVVGQDVGVEGPEFVHPPDGLSDERVEEYVLICVHGARGDAVNQQESAVMTLTTGRRNAAT
jgi:hypothetical protein